MNFLGDQLLQTSVKIKTIMMQIQGKKILTKQNDALDW